MYIPMTEPEVGMGGATVVELVTPVDHWLVTPIVVTVLWVVFEVVCVAGVTVVLLLSGSGDVEALLTAVVFVSIIELKPIKRIRKYNTHTKAKNNTRKKNY